MNNLYFFIGGFVLLWIAINTVIYFFLKYKRRLFFEYIKDRKYILLPNIETEIEGYSKFGSKISYRKADIIFLEDNVFLCTFNKPIIQLTKNQDFFPSIYCRYTYDSKIKIKNRLQIKNSDGSLKIYLNFKNKNFDLERYLNESE
ncbi:hypothetical protein SAMN05443633_1049 [Chryseobacterium arachidis]|uniref:GRAM domain-containing protein n=1 Tax=Chryseobacterium arachidis TaxID=1416778 RepID=A0A1M5B291_9FLAO|nr:hypothetical protein [Chryseobacterium arachidis]SHF36526.1 hypothetical protein SAMN05443633_1049 [Chryseobacterium arachidis]